jgi:hypothetical protein
MEYGSLGLRIDEIAWEIFILRVFLYDFKGRDGFKDLFTRDEPSF